ncbi:MAG: cupin domain-containing protein [Emcibacter sp.]|nr:cupin domain-containing protein [Emcibacter sp.]
MLDTETKQDGKFHKRDKHEVWDDGSLIVKTEQVPWTEWALPGTRFKLLDYNRNISYVVFLLKIDADATPTIHKHIGAANAYILQGGFYYDKGGVREGDYFVEAGGVSHTPVTDEDGCLLLGFGNGAIAGFNEDGSVAGIIDVDWMIDAAKANNAFAHLENAVRS